MDNKNIIDFYIRDTTNNGTVLKLIKKYSLYKYLQMNRVFLMP